MAKYPCVKTGAENADKIILKVIKRKYQCYFMIYKAIMYFSVSFSQEKPYTRIQLTQVHPLLFPIAVKNSRAHFFKKYIALIFKVSYTGLFAEN